MESNWEPSRGKREHDKRPSSSSRGRHRAPPLPLPPPASTPTSRAFFDPDARPTARQAQMQQEERERRMLVAQQIAAELRLKAEAREREQRKQRKQEERAAATAAAAAAAAGAGAGAGERSGGPPPSSSAAAAAPAVAARSFFNPRDRPTARQQAEMEREEEEARVRRRARASAAAAAAAEREAAEAAAAAAAAAAKKNKGKKRVLEDEDGDGERRANPPPLALRPLPPKRTAIAISPRLTTARPRQQQQQWQQQRQQQQPFSSSPSLVRPPAVAVAFPAPPAAAPATRRTEMNLVQLLQQRRQQQQQQRATAAGGNGRKRPAAAAARGGAPPLVSSSSRATAAAAAASSFRGVPASADQEAHLAAANDLLAAEAMDGRLWFAACADGDEEGGTGGGAAAAGAAPPSSSSLPPVPASFPSARAYVGSFLPLVLEEARQEVRSSWAEAVAAGNKSWPVSVERVDGLGGGGERGGAAAAAAAAAGAAEAEAKAKAAPESPFCGPPLSSRTAAAAAMPPGAAPPLSASSPPSPPAPAVEARLRFPGARPPPGALRDGDVVVVTRGIPPGGRGGAGKGEGPEEPPLDWAAGGRARAAAEGVELEEGELALDAAAAAAAARAATASGQQQQPLRPPPPATGRDRGGACPVAGVIRFSGNAVTLTTRCRCPRHHRGGGGAGAGKGGGEEEDPPCVAALRSLAAAASSSSSSSATRQEDGGRRWHLTVVGNLVTHAREVAALFAMPAMPLARALLSPGAAAAAAGAAAARWPSEASSRAFIGKLQETYDHAQLRAIEVAAGHLSAGGAGGGGGGGSCDRRDGGGGGSSAPPRPPLFTLVQGPPGTGKTHTVTGILNVWHLVAYQRHHAATIAALTRGGGGGGSGSGGGAFPPGLLADFAPTLPFATNSSNSNSKPRLLVCAPSNAAADELLARVMDRGFFDGHGRTYRPDVVRVGADSSPMTERAREVWVEGNALALLEAPPAQRSAELQQARWDSARARRQVEALRLSFPPAPSASASAAASAAAAAGAAAREAAAGDLAAAADALDKVEALVERLEIADRAAQGGGGNGGGGGGADRRQARERLEALLVSRAEVVFTTLSSTGRRVFRRLAAVFDTVLVDEAAQATEPALLQALRFGARSVALVGDPRQLPATVRSGGAARAGLARSLFERLAGGEGGGGGGGAGGARGAVGRGPRLAVGSSPAPSRPAPPAAAAAAGVPVELLRVQYRMHPEIRSFPSRAFYAGALEDSAAVRSRPAEPWQRREGGGGGLLLGPYLFFDVARGREARGAGRGGAAPFFASGSLSSTPSFSSSASSSSSSPSLRNDEEAALAAALVAELRRECSRLGAPFPSVGVITPYRAQAAALRQELERAGGGRGGRGWCTAVETVDGFQGKEVDVAIVSCVRSRGGGGRDYRHDGGGDGDGSDAAVAAVASLSVSLSSSTLGFVDDLRRLNVAVTRARRALWVLGSGEALRRGSGAWAALLADASRRGLVVRGEDAWGRIRHRAQGQQEGRGGAGGEGGGTSL